jgi:hypothetical protein
MIDIAIQVYGSIEALFDLVLDNNLEVDADLTPGQVLHVLDILPVTADPIMVAYYISQGIVVNSGADVAIAEVLATNDDEVFTTNDNEGITL